MFGASRALVLRGTDSSHDNGKASGSTNAKTKQVVIYRAKWVSLKDEIGHSSVELVRLDSYVPLLTKAKVSLDHKCT